MIDSTTYDLTSLNAGFQGRLLTRTDLEYDSERRVWNAMINWQPAVIAKCASIEDIETALHIARSRGLEIAVRGGCHNIAGHALFSCRKASARS